MIFKIVIWLVIKVALDFIAGLIGGVLSGRNIALGVIAGLVGTALQFYAAYRIFGLSDIWIPFVIWIPLFILYTVRNKLRKDSEK